MSTLASHFVSSSREREKRESKDSRGDKRKGPGRKRIKSENEEPEEIKTFFSITAKRKTGLIQL